MTNATKKEKQAGNLAGKDWSWFSKHLRLGPPKSEAILNLELLKKGKVLEFTVRPSLDAKSLSVILSDKKPVSEEFFDFGMAHYDAEGGIVSYELVDVGSAREPLEFGLRTTIEGVVLDLRIGTDGGLTVSLKGSDLSEASSTKHPSSDFVTVHSIDGKAIGYTIEGYLKRANMSFNGIRVNLQLE